MAGSVRMRQQARVSACLGAAGTVALRAPDCVLMQVTSRSHSCCSTSDLFLRGIKCYAQIRKAILRLGNGLMRASRVANGRMTIQVRAYAIVARCLWRSSAGTPPVIQPGLLA